MLKLDLTALGFESISDALATAEAICGGLELDFGNGDRLVLLGETISTIEDAILV